MSTMLSHRDEKKGQRDGYSDSKIEDFRAGEPVEETDPLRTTMMCVSLDTHEAIMNGF